MQISRFRLSDKTSRLRPRHVVPKPGQTYEPEVPVEVREWIAPAPSSPDFVLRGTTVPGATNALSQRPLSRAYPPVIASNLKVAFGYI